MFHNVINILFSKSVDNSNGPISSFCETLSGILPVQSFQCSFLVVTSKKK